MSQGKETHGSRAWSFCIEDESCMLGQVPVMILWLCDSTPCSSCGASGADGYCCEGSTVGAAAGVEGAEPCANAEVLCPSARYTTASHVKQCLDP